jgi:tetrapyrrole methylase family protein / MazG family protein
VSASPLHVTVISAEHIGHLPDIPVVSRTRLSHPVPPSKTVTCLDELQLDSDFWTAEWQENLLSCLFEASTGNEVGYVVPGHPMLGDVTMQFLISADSRKRIDLELYDEPLPVILTEALSLQGGSPAFVDTLTLLDIARNEPFASGSLPLSTSQSVIITNLVPGVNGAVLARMLGKLYRPVTAVQLIPMTDVPEQVELELSELANEASGFPCYLVLPPASGDDFQRSSQDLQRLVARLRAPDGCPWDREQSNESLSRNLIEESYELLEAIESGNTRAFREELGDFLLQAYLHSQIAEESTRFSLEDVLETLIDKLVRRHPHVFDTSEAEDADAVVQTWDEIKRAERAARPDDQRHSPLGDIPASLPALVRAQNVIKRSRRAMISNDALSEHEASALASLSSPAERDAVDTILRIVHLAQAEGIDLEQSVRSWTRAFESEVNESTTKGVPER